MNRLNFLPDRALELASKVGDNFHHVMPSAGTWLQTGVKLGALKSGARVAGIFLRRHPVITVATAAGAGLLWYAAHRKAKHAENGNGTIEGSSKRVEARRANGGGARRTSTTRKRATRKSAAAE